MASFGRTLVRGLGAAMQGYGKTLLQQDERDQKERESQSIMNRQIALEAIRAETAMRQTDYAGRVTERTYRNNKATDVDAETAILPVQTAAKIAINQADTAADRASKEAILALQHKYNLTEIDARAAADIKKELELAGQTVDRFEITADGKGAFFNKKGDLIRATGAGAFTPPRAKGDDEGDDDYRPIPRRTAAGGAQAPAAPRLPAPAAGAPDYTEFNTILAQAAASPLNRNKLPGVVRKETIELARSMGIKTPAQ